MSLGTQHGFRPKRIGTRHDRVWSYQELFFPIVFLDLAEVTIVYFPPMDMRRQEERVNQDFHAGIAASTAPAE
jgi:hypothetical protein